jgi:hypothetical protein
VPSFDGLEPLAPDACRSDPAAPCYYLHLKRRALNGERDKLSARELAFVGIFPPRRRDGWCQPGESSGLFAVDEQDADPELTSVLQALVNRERLEFLGG